MKHTKEQLIGKRFTHETDNKFIYTIEDHTKSYMVCISWAGRGGGSTPYLVTHVNDLLQSGSWIPLKQKQR